MILPILVTVEALDWVFGRPASDDEQEPLFVRDVSPTGEHVWIADEAQGPFPGAQLTEYVAHSVPEQFRDRALALRRLVVDCPPDLPSYMRLITRSLSDENTLAYASEGMNLDDLRPSSPVDHRRRFKARPKKLPKKRR